MLDTGWKSVGKVLVFALLLDVVYQIIVLRFVYPGEAIVVSLVLVILPYLILRGLVTRLAGPKMASRMTKRTRIVDRPVR